MSAIDLAKFEQLKATGDLPSPKGPALAIIRLTQKESTSIADLANVVKTDPAFVGRLIKSANSVQSGGRRPIASIQDALIVLGIPAVRSLALGFSLISGFRSGNCRNFDFNRFWSRSLVLAVAFQALTLRTRAAPADEAFSIGLLSHIGELALATLFPDEYSRLLGDAREGSLNLLEVEKSALVMTHTELTVAMMKDWGLPKVFTEPVLQHELPESASFPEGARDHVLMWSLVLAGHIADICLAAESERRAMMPQMLRLGSRLSIDADVLNALCDRVANDWREWGSMLDVPTSQLPPFADLSQSPPPPQIMGSPLAEGGEAGYRMRCLVVDDESSMRVLLKALLMAAGHEVFEASNGQQGFEMAIDLRPQIVIADWLMPEMTGIEMTRALRQTRLGRSMYILILTALEEDEKLVEAFEAGVDDFMSKPLRPRVLAARLRAGQRVIKLQQEIERDREEIRSFAAELSVANRRLQETALTDSLTGFPNRRFAIERIQQEWATATRNRRPLACMVVDVDQFKQINDTHGHDIGDLVLRQTAIALKSGLRAQDVVCRMGGDEFLVISPDTTLDAALACAERVRRAVIAMRVQCETLELRGSVSIGVAVRDPAMANVDALIKCADQGLYRAKQAGRNRIGALQSAN
jgi:diguanylate cyclase (GGDEF)-like protein